MEAPANSTATAPTQSNRSLEGKFLTFSLGEEEYGIDILQIQEIIGLMPITPIPHSPHYAKGVINLRGKVIPVLDLRLRFDLPEGEKTERTCIIVVEISTSAHQQAVVGLVVDSVSEVSPIKEDNIDLPPSFGAGAIDSGYILGMAKLDSGVKILLDINRIFSANEVAGLVSPAT